MQNFIFEKIKRVQALAEIGLEFSQNSFDRERYDELHEISLQILSQILKEAWVSLQPCNIPKSNWLCSNKKFDYQRGERHKRRGFSLL